MQRPCGIRESLAGWRTRKKAGVAGAQWVRGVGKRDKIPVSKASIYMEDSRTGGPCSSSLVP